MCKFATEIITETNNLKHYSYMKTTLLSLKAFFTICLLCLVGGVNVMAQDTETVDFTKQGYKNQEAVSAYTGTNFQIAFLKGSGADPKFYDNGNALRVIIIISPLVALLKK